MARVTAEQGAELLGMPLPTFKRYRSAYGPGKALPTFPPPDANGTWLPSALLRWNGKRPGQGNPGVSRPKSTYPCEVCGTLVKRRNKDEVDGKLKCRPCYVSGDPMLKEA